MVFDAKCYGDPAKHVRFIRETDKCHGCKHSLTLLGVKFCDIGVAVAKLKRPCLKWSKK